MQSKNLGEVVANHLYVLPVQRTLGSYSASMLFCSQNVYNGIREIRRRARDLTGLRDDRKPGIVLDSSSSLVPIPEFIKPKILDDIVMKVRVRLPFTAAPSIKVRKTIDGYELASFLMTAPGNEKIYATKPTDLTAKPKYDVFLGTDKWFARCGVESGTDIAVSPII